MSLTPEEMERDQAEAGQTVDLGSFEQYLEDE